MTCHTEINVNITIDKNRAIAMRVELCRDPRNTQMQCLLH